MSTILKTERILVRTLAPDDFPQLREMDRELAGLRFLNGGREKTAEESRKVFDTMISLYRSRNLGFHAWESLTDTTFLGWGHDKIVSPSNLYVLTKVY